MPPLLPPPSSPPLPTLTVPLLTPPPLVQIIGKQWFSWCLFEDLHYRFELAGARQYAEAPEEVRGLLEVTAGGNSPH